MKSIVIQLLCWLLPMIAGAQGCLLVTDYDSLPIFTPDTMKTRSAPLPAVHSMKNRCPPVRDQGDCNACCPWAVGYYGMSILHNLKDTPYSPYFVCEKTGKCDIGMNPLEAYTIMATTLVPDIADTPPCTNLPCCKTSVQEIVPLRLESLKTPDLFKKALAENRPIILVLDLSTVKVEPTQDNGYQWIITAFNEPKTRKLHAVCVIGYDETNDSVEIVNSKGLKWGNKGFAKISFEYLFAKHDDLSKMNMQAFVLPKSN
jgi:Papain family cysteine protease